MSSSPMLLIILGGSFIISSPNGVKGLQTNSISLHPEPGFVGHLKNVTVPEGRDVTLSCTVKNLDKHKVAWIHYDRSAILTVKDNVITRNPRIGISHDGDRTWNLHIRDVQRSDQGAYMCQINTAKAKTRLAYLSVVVPPRIEDSLSSGDKVRTEGSNVTLECTARGSPEPRVIWKREDGRNINIDKANNISVPHVEGRVLRLYKVSRLDMGAYMCIASNGVPPAVSKRIQLGIDFPPMMWVPAQQTSAIRYSSITLKCFVEAHPEALTYWEHDGRMVQAGTRFVPSITIGNPSYKIEMKLEIRRIEERDFGMYKCYAKNPRGKTDGTIMLSEEIPPTTTTLEPPTTTTTTTTSTTTSAPLDSDKEGKAKNWWELDDWLSKKQRKKSNSKDRYKNQNEMDHELTNFGSKEWYQTDNSSSKAIRLSEDFRILFGILLIIPRLQEALLSR